MIGSGVHVLAFSMRKFMVYKPRSEQEHFFLVVRDCDIGVRKESHEHIENEHLEKSVSITTENKSTQSHINQRVYPLRRKINQHKVT